MTENNNNSFTLEPHIRDMRNSVSRFLSTAKARQKASGELGCEDLRELIHDQLVEDMIEELVEKQLQLNKKKSIPQIEKKTFSQSQGYLLRLFGTANDEEFLLCSGMLLLYLQERKDSATFNGFEKFYRANKSKPMKDLTERYFDAVLETEKEALFALIEEETDLLVHPSEVG